MVCYDMDGRWCGRRTSVPSTAAGSSIPTYQWGHASSPVIYKSSVIVQADQAKGSFIAAFNLEDGRELWRTSRTDEVSTWGTPTILSGPKGDELVTNGTKIRGYAPATGALLWTLAPNPRSRSVHRWYTAMSRTSPAAIRRCGPCMPCGRARAATSRCRRASRPARRLRGVTTGTAPTSPRRSSIATALHAEQQRRPHRLRADRGERLFRARVGGGGAFSASPVAADGRSTWRTRTATWWWSGRPRLVELARNSMGEAIMATPGHLGRCHRRPHARSHLGHRTVATD